MKTLNDYMAMSYRMEIVEDKYVSTAFGLQATVGRGIGAAVVQLIGGKLIDSFSTMTPFYLFLSVLIVTALVLSLTFKEKSAQNHKSYNIIK